MQQNEVVDLQKFRDAESGSVLQEDSGPNYLPSGTKLLIGQYTIEGYLNCGGFGITYTARDSLNRKIVIKECFPAEMVYRDGKTMRTRRPRYQDEISAIVRNFVTEAQSLANLKHENIIHVHQIFEENNTAYIAMDFVDGPDLLDLIETDKRLTSREIQKLTLTMLDAIGYVHRMGMLHRDISPDNILIDRSGEPVLIDFGAVRLHIQKTQQALAKMKFVKDGYSPQEFYVAGADQGTYSDLYAFAASIYHMIRGEAPIDGEARRAALEASNPDPYVPLVGNIKGYPQKFLAAIDQALAFEPNDRLQTAEAWIAMIKPGIIRLSIMSRPATAVMESLTIFDEVAKTSGAQAARKDKTLLVAGISAIALLAGTAFLIGALPTSEPAPKTVVLDLPSPLPTMVDAGLQPPGSELAPKGVFPLSDTAHEADRRAPVLGETTIASAPTIGTSPVRSSLPSLNSDSGPRIAEVRSIGRPGKVLALDTPLGAANLPAIPAPLDPPPPLTGKLDISSFASAQATPQGDSFGAFEPVDPPVYVAALPRVAADTDIGADTTPPAARPTGAVLHTQIAHSYWNVAMPFSSELTTDGEPAGAKITSVSTDADLSRSGDWIAEGTIITHFAGEPLRPDTPLSIHVLDAMPTAVDGLIRAPVQYRDAVMGFAGAGELAVPVVREIALADGTVLETRKDGQSWTTSVRELGQSTTNLRAGDILISETETGRWFNGHGDVEAALNALSEAGTELASFTVLRSGVRGAAYWTLARN